MGDFKRGTRAYRLYQNKMFQNKVELPVSPVLDHCHCADFIEVRARLGLILWGRILSCGTDFIGTSRQDSRPPNARSNTLVCLI